VYSFELLFFESDFIISLVEPNCESIFRNRIYEGISDQPAILVEPDLALEFVEFDDNLVLGLESVGGEGVGVVDLLAALAAQGNVVFEGILAVVQVGALEQADDQT